MGWYLTDAPPALPAPGTPGPIPGTMTYGDPGIGGGDTSGLPPGASTLPPYLPGQPTGGGPTQPAPVSYPGQPVSGDLWQEFLALGFLLVVGLLLPERWSKWFIGLILLGSIIKSAPLWAKALTALNQWAGSL